MKTNRKLVSYIPFLCLLSTLLQGPSQLLPDEFLILCTGHFFYGFFIPFLRTPIQLVLESKVEEIFGTEKKNEMAESLSTIYMLATGLTQVFAFLSSEFLSSLIGFRAAYDALALAIALCIVFYIGTTKAYIDLF